MQEFSSVSASAYEPDALTAQLNEKAGDGWEVVSIVSAGTNVVAYLSREAAEPETSEEGGGLDEDVVEAEVVADAVEPDSTGDVEAVEVAEVVEESPIEEPSGWAAAPEEATVDPTPTGSDAFAAGAAAGGMAAAADSAATEPAVEQPAAAEPAAEPAPASEPSPAVPAGWYSDPSGRFELRYWDGTAWTEHVSRAGQQFTDPPVA